MISISTSHSVNQNLTSLKILSFLEFSQGWHSGEGIGFNSEIVNIALELNSFAFSLGYIETDAFPGLNGEIRVTIYHENEYLEFTIEANDNITFLHERSEIEIEESESITVEEAKQKIQNLQDRIWELLGFLAPTTMIPENTDSQALPLEIQVEVGSRLSTSNASWVLANPSATISENIIRTQQASHLCFGSSTEQFLPMKDTG